MKSMVLRQENGLSEVTWESGGGLGVHLCFGGDVCGQVSRWLESNSDMKVKVVCLCCANPQYIVLVGKLSMEAALGIQW